METGHAMSRPSWQKNRQSLRSEAQAKLYTENSLRKPYLRSGRVESFSVIDHAGHPPTSEAQELSGLTANAGFGRSMSVCWNRKSLFTGIVPARPLTPLI
jgi:hypothetical protein